MTLAGTISLPHDSEEKVMMQSLASIHNSVIYFQEDRQLPN